MVPILLLLSCGAFLTTALEEDCNAGNGLDDEDPLFLIQKGADLTLALERAWPLDALKAALKINATTHAQGKEKDQAQATNVGAASKKASEKIATKTGAAKNADEKESSVWPWPMTTFTLHFPWPKAPWGKFDNDKSLGQNLFANWSEYIIPSFLTWLTWLVLAFLVWNCCFPVSPEHIFPDMEDPVQHFNNSHFGCFEAGKICLCSFFCPALQWADTMHLAGFLKMWPAFGVFFACALVNSLVLGGVAQFGVATSILIIVYRQKLRQKFKLHPWSCASCAFDFIYVCCCPCCAIAQEARVVRYAYQNVQTETGSRPYLSALPGSQAETGSLARLSVHSYQAAARLVPTSRATYSR